MFCPATNDAIDTRQQTYVALSIPKVQTFRHQILWNRNAKHFVYKSTTPIPRSPLQTLHALTIPYAIPQDSTRRHIIQERKNNEEREFMVRCY